MSPLGPTQSNPPSPPAIAPAPRPTGSGRATQEDPTARASSKPVDERFPLGRMPGTSQLGHQAQRLRRASLSRLDSSDAATLARSIAPGVSVEQLALCHEINGILSGPVSEEEIREVSVGLESNLRTKKAPLTLDSKEVQRNLETIALANRASKFLGKQGIPHVFTARSHEHTVIDMINGKIAEGLHGMKLAEHAILARRGYADVVSIRATGYDDDEHETYGKVIFSGSTNILDYSPSESALSYVIRGKSEYEMESDSFLSIINEKLSAGTSSPEAKAQCARDIKSAVDAHVPSLPNRILNVFYYPSGNLPDHLIMSEPFGGTGEQDSEDHVTLKNRILEENLRSRNQNSCSQVRGLLPDAHTAGIRGIRLIGSKDKEIFDEMRLEIERAVDRILR